MKSIGAIVISSSILFLLLFCLTMPSFALAVAPTTPGADGLIPCAGPDCNFSHIIQFANKIVDWLLRIAIPVTAALFSYAGFLYLTSGGDSGKKTAAHKVFKSVFIGFVMALSAWILVNFLTNLFLKKDINEVVPISQGGIIETYDLV